MELRRQESGGWAAVGALTKSVWSRVGVTDPNLRAASDQSAKIRGKIVEYNLTEHCNLRCAGCAHASPLLARRFGDLDSFRRDVAVLSTVLHVEEMKFLGGEPLLHPRLTDFLRSARESGIADKITVVTNGVLLHRCSEELFELIDKLFVSIYPGVTIRADLRQVRERARRNRVKLTLSRIDRFRYTLIDQPLRSAELVNRIYKQCDLAHYWSCHTIYEGYYYKCSSAPFMEAYLSTRGVRFENRLMDGVAIHDNPHLREDLERYLANQTPLLACDYCLGSSGREFAHHQLPAEACRKAGEPDPTKPETLLERRPDRLARQAAIRIVRSYLDRARGLGHKSGTDAGGKSTAADPLQAA
jgi:MoaA/NifB/PqqE/SkfB family radical SAM enzyme